MRNTIKKGQNAENIKPMLMEMLIVIGVESYRAGLNAIGNLVMQAVKELENDTREQAAPLPSYATQAQSVTVM